MKIFVEKTNEPKSKPSAEGLSFGTIFSDHMIICNYSPEMGWHNARITQYRDLSLSPSP